MERLHGVILKTFPYSESSKVVKCFTKEKGLISILARGVKKKTKNQPQLNLLQPCIFEVSKSPKSDLHLLKEVSSIAVFDSCTSNPIKIAIQFFVADFSYSLLQSDLSIDGLFEYYTRFISTLESNQNISNIHFAFINQMVSFLGIQPQNNYSEAKTQFDLPLGCFQSGEKLDAYFSRSLSIDLSNFYSVKLNKQEKSWSLELWEKYFSYHLGYYRPNQSLPVLVQLFSD